ncbi:hypothetical protein PRUPE_8G191600 [Prunus persica]|uniref:Uncharacterized protein n=1 Tax=Prunus persica TaxID=3760 RepID=A0A251N091_PRUPE|nr:hypothetical protein PRUPE_8G191600 [Prunus persica]
MHYHGPNLSKIVEELYVQDKMMGISSHSIT